MSATPRKISIICVVSLIGETGGLGDGLQVLIYNIVLAVKRWRIFASKEQKQIGTASI